MSVCSFRAISGPGQGTSPLCDVGSSDREADWDDSMAHKGRLKYD
jgi:hypothetical protein